jgi:hypothetical protein
MSRVTAWYVSHGSGAPATGPFATDLVRAMLRDGQLNPMDLVFREGESEWLPASTYSELKALPSSSSWSSEKSGLLKTDSSDSDFAPKTDAQGNSSSAINDSDVSWIVLRLHASTYLQEGPFKTEFIREGLIKGSFQFSQYAWHIGMPQWMRIGDLSEFDRRSTPRDATPHIPPPLPDPISAVLLEDDGDFESEEFHVNLKPSKFDATPTDLAMIFGSGKESVAVGGAAAKSFDLIAQDLARVPWEERIPASKDHSSTNARAVELIDDESSFSGYSDRESSIEDAGESDSFQFDERRAKDDFSPKPFVAPPAAASPSKRQEDGWEKWGRYVAAVGMGAITAVFSGHLLTYENSARADHNRRSAEIAKMGTSSKPNVSDSTSQPQNSNPPMVDATTQTAPIAIRETLTQNAKVPSTAANASGHPNELVSGLDVDDPMTGPEGALPAVPVSASVVANTSGSDASIVGLKLTSPDAQILLQGAFPAGRPIEVTFRGRLGEVLAKLNVRKTITITKTGAEIPSIKLKEIGLPDGAYTVEVSSMGIQLKSDLFLGKRDSRFLDRLEAHLRERSFELQAQKKVLFYAAQELDSLARDLGLNYGQLRSKPEMWARFFSKWKTKISAVERSIGELSNRTVEDLAFPEETLQLSSLLANLIETSKLFEQGVGAQRDVASDSLTDLISELARQKEAIGSATTRASPPASKEPTSKAL